MDVISLISNVFTSVFLLIVFSYYALLFIRRPKPDVQKTFKSISIIVPAHNEELYIEKCINSLLKAKFVGKKQIIAIDDASKDTTAKILKSFGKKITVITNKKHSGKSFSMNRALKIAKGELTAIVDGDSIIYEDALLELAKEVGRDNTAAACSVVKVQNRNVFLNAWVHVELLYNSLIRGLFSKIGANITTPGALSMYRTKTLREIGGFNTDGFSEDVDVAIRLIRKGYHVGFSEFAVSETNMPHQFKWFFKQRTRFARGLIHVLKRNMQMNSTIIDMYTLPLYLFMYIQAVIMGSLTIYQLANGYMTYFVAQDIYMSLGVAKFFFEWFSLVGFFKWTHAVITGIAPLTWLNLVGIVSSSLSYPLFIYAILRYEKRFDLLHAIPIMFMFPFWLVLMVVQILCVPEIIKREQYNIWKKND